MPLPGLPQLRQIEGTVGTFLKETRTFLAALRDLKLLSGKFVPVSFTAADVAGTVTKRIQTGLGYAPTGFFVINGHNGGDLIQVATPSTETDITVVYVKSTAVCTYTIWVF